MANEKKAVIFDLDGVLVDTGKFHRQSWYDLAEKEGFRMTDEFFYETFGMQNNQILPRLARRPLTADEIDRLSDWKEQRYRDLAAGGLRPLEGVPDLIKNLKENGFLLAVGSSTPRKNIDFIIEQLHLADVFDAEVSSEDVTRGKPAPDTFLKAAEKLDVPTRRCAVVEDAVAGIQSAKAAGMAVVAVTTTRKRSVLTQADMVVDSLAELSAADFAGLLEKESCRNNE